MKIKLKIISFGLFLLSINAGIRKFAFFAFGATINIGKDLISQRFAV
jgi:hypothetical protein